VLRSGRAVRRPHGRRTTPGARIAGMTSIDDRPAEAAGRQVPGHREGDPVIGQAGQTTLASLVERTSRHTEIVALPKGKRDAQTTCDALIGAVAGMPARLLRSLTWDQGPELAAHAALTPAASIPVYVAHPHSPWERGTTENTSGLIRQHFPNGATITDDQACLSAVAAELHNRPRRIRIPSPRRSLHRASHQLICFHRLAPPAGADSMRAHDPVPRASTGRRARSGR
jgi:IS30 family transposase